MKEMTKTQYICRVALGVALFVALAFCVQVPIFENYYICLGYLAMIVYLYKFGPLAGTIVGTLGVLLYCILISGMRGLPGWFIGNLAIGISMGFILKWTKNQKKVTFYIVNSISIVIITICSILILKSATESILYSQPIFVRFGKNIYACIADIVVLILGLPFCHILDRVESTHKISA